MIIFVYGSLMDGRSRSRSISESDCRVLGVAQLPASCGFRVEANTGGARGPVYLGLRQSTAAPTGVHGLLLDVSTSGVRSLLARETYYRLSHVNAWLSDGTRLCAFVPRHEWLLPRNAPERLTRRYKRIVRRGCRENGIPAPRPVAFSLW